MSSPRKWGTIAWEKLKRVNRLVILGVAIAVRGTFSLRNPHDRLLAGHLSHLDLFRNPDHRRRLCRALGFRLLFGEAETLTFERGNERWSVPVGDRVVSSWLFETGGFQMDELTKLLEWLDNQDNPLMSKPIVLEVGANLGTTTIPLARLTNKHVIAVEPDPRNFEYLCCNVALNRLDDRVRCVNVAISSQEGLIDFVSDRDNWGSSHVRALGSRADASKREDAVRACSLDMLIEDCGTSPADIAFVWSDTEGHETQVIKSGATLWETGVPLWVELNATLIRRYGSEKEFSEIAERHFKRFIVAADLAWYGPDAKTRPIEALRDSVARTHHMDKGTDVLLLPF